MRKFMKKAAALVLAAALAVPVMGISAQAAEITFDAEGKVTFLAAEGAVKNSDGNWDFTGTAWTHGPESAIWEDIDGTGNGVNAYEDKQGGDYMCLGSIAPSEIGGVSIRYSTKNSHAVTLHAGVPSTDNTLATVSVSPTDNYTTLAESDMAEVSSDSTVATGIYLQISDANNDDLKLVSVTLYKKASSGYTITVDGTPYTDIPYNAKVTVTDDSADFECWVKNGYPVSCDSTYSFYVCEDATITTDVGTYDVCEYMVVKCNENSIDVYGETWTGSDRDITERSLNIKNGADVNPWKTGYFKNVAVVDGGNTYQTKFTVNNVSKDTFNVTESAELQLKVKDRVSGNTNQRQTSVAKGDLEDITRAGGTW